MKLQLYNTLKGEKEPFEPINPPHVGLYTCGPTVYNYAHIGNLRAYVFADVLRRTLEYGGHKVRHVMNITDVGHLTSDADDGDDKMVKGLKRDGLPLTLGGLQQLADKYTSAFMEDLKALNCELPHEMPRASENIKEDIELIQKLEQKGVAYKTSDGMYFDTAKFPAYGTRGGFQLGDLKEGARVAINVEKKNPRDFSLWKFSSGEFGWESPWGRGFPGWHIECSAMSRKYLGQPFDIHTGGIDHIPTHHQNEIAQSEAAYGVPLVNYWMHNEHLNMGEAKMAKSGENFITLQTLKDRGIHPLAYRYHLLQAHYRSPIAFSWGALEAAQTAYYKLLYTFASASPSSSVVPAEVGIQSVFDDLGTAEVIASVWKLAKEKNRKAILEADAVLGLDIENQSRKLAEEMNAVPDSIKKLASAREDARRQKDFKKSDELREQIQEEGFDVMDTDSGSILRKKL
jgi:cysteinyl-tRNA synthetase